MAEKKIAVGDPVLWYGYALTVVALHDKDGVSVAELVDQKGLEVRNKAMEEVAALREEQATLTGEEHAARAGRIRELDRETREAVVRVKLRRDLLSFWEARGVWVSDGRILNNTQIEKFKSIFKAAPLPEAQRAALDLIEGRN